MSEQVSQVKFDRNFVKKLLDKLKVGNARSIHLNAVPGRRADRLDLHKFGLVDKQLPLGFIETLLSKEAFSFKVSFDNLDIGALDEEQKKSLGLLSKRLNSIAINNQDGYLEFGIKNFGIGYPLLIKRDKSDPSRIIKAPLLIWDLDIDVSLREKNTWKIKKSEDSPIKLNELLISHLSKDESIQLNKISREVLADGIVDADELLEICKSILAQLNVTDVNLNLKVESCPDAKAIEKISNNKPWIQWSGIFGMYRSQKETTIQATEGLLERFEEFANEKLTLERFQTSTISPVDIDPSKEEILNSLTKNEIKLIQGPPGTGKSQSITSIISNTLANSGTCLVVCEKKTALDVVYENLKKIGLEDFSIVIDDVNKDRKKVIEKARRISEQKKIVRFSELEYTQKYDNLCKIKKAVNARYSEGLSKVFGDYTWKDLIGWYLRLSKLVGFKDVLAGLESTSINVNHEGFLNLLEVIDEGAYLYEAVGFKRESDFSFLKEKVFEVKYSWSVQKEVENKASGLSELLGQALELVNNSTLEDFSIIDGVSIFYPKALLELEDYLIKLKEHLQNVIDLYKIGEGLVSSLFQKNNLIFNLFFVAISPISGKTKKALTLKKQILEEIAEANAVVDKINKLGFDELVVVNLKIKIPKLLMEESTKTLSKAQGLMGRVQRVRLVEKKLLRFQSKLNEDSFLRMFNYADKQLPDHQSQSGLKKYLKKLSEEVQLIMLSLNFYEQVHHWKHFLQHSSPKEQKIFEVLKSVNTLNWRSLFKAYFFQKVLIEYEENSTAGFNKSDDSLRRIEALEKELKEVQVDKIESDWLKRRNQKLSFLGFNFNALYNLRKNKQFARRNSLRRILETDFELFSLLFPVVLINPDAANAILPLRQGLFNVVIFDEASQLRVADTFTSFIRGQYKVIAGDEHQMPPSNYFQGAAEELNIEDEEEVSFTKEDEQSVLAESESLLQFAKDLSCVSKSYLDFHYRSKHPSLIQFSNSAFYGGNLVSFPNQKPYSPIEFRAVNGLYDSGTNFDEVDEVIRILREDIEMTTLGDYPSVGIATFNIQQRNLILEAINKLASIDESFREKAAALYSKGLFVKNLENIQGDERDVIIISTTYGVKPDGKFYQSFSRLNHVAGYKLLNVLVTRAKSKLYLCTSIPKGVYRCFKDYIQQQGNDRKGILYAYLAYAEAVSNNDLVGADDILQVLKEYSFEKPRELVRDEGLSESVFEEEVLLELRDHFEEDEIIQQYSVGGFRLDFLLKVNGLNIVLECDGKSYHQSEEAYAYDMYRQQELESMGYIVYRVWSTCWFQNKDREVKKFLEFVETSVPESQRVVVAS